MKDKEDFNEYEAWKIIEPIAYVLGALSVENKVWEKKLRENLISVLEPGKDEVRMKVKSMIEHFRNKD